MFCAVSVGLFPRGGLRSPRPGPPTVSRRRGAIESLKDNNNVIYLFVTHGTRDRPTTYPQHIHNLALDTNCDNLVQCINNFSGRSFNYQPWRLEI